MSMKKNRNPGKVPPGNQKRNGPAKEVQERDQKAGETVYQQADPKHRQGDFNNTADHSIQEPGGKNDANH